MPSTSGVSSEYSFDSWRSCRSSAPGRPAYRPAPHAAEPPCRAFPRIPLPSYLSSSPSSRNSRRGEGPPSPRRHPGARRDRAALRMAWCSRRLTGSRVAASASRPRAAITSSRRRSKWRRSATTAGTGAPRRAGRARKLSSSSSTMTRWPRPPRRRDRRGPPSPRARDRRDRRGRRRRAS